MRRWFLAAAFALGLAAPALAKPPVWIVRDTNSEMLIFGSAHLLPKGLDWRPAALDAALPRADDVWFELPVNPAAQDEAARLARKRGVMPLGHSLFTMIPPDLAARLMRLADLYGVDKLVLDRLEPWMAEVTLEGGAYRQGGGLEEAGVEAVLAAAAPPTARRRAFETVSQQIDMLDGAPLKDQIAGLAETVEEMERRPKAYGEIVRAWMAGDLAFIERESLQSLARASPVLLDRVITRRNARWTKTLAARLKGKGRTVVVVGMGHLIGPGGVPARLRALGYSVEGP